MCVCACVYMYVYMYFREVMLHFCVTTLSCTERHCQMWQSSPSTVAHWCWWRWWAATTALCTLVRSNICSDSRQKAYNIFCMVQPGGSSSPCCDLTIQPHTPSFLSLMGLPLGSVWSITCSYHSGEITFQDQIPTQPLTPRCKKIPLLLYSAFHFPLLTLFCALNILTY